MEREVADVLTTLDDHHMPLAAICAATTAIVRAGLIRGRRHTSDGLEYLKKQVPNYTDAALYVDASGVDSTSWLLVS